jgi:integrase/recombinase XerD
LIFNDIESEHYDSWLLGHEQIETTHVYLHADLELKERTLAKTTPANTAPGRYRPPDKLLAFLEAL